MCLGKEQLTIPVRVLTDATPIFCNEKPMKILLDKEINIKKSFSYDSDEVDEVYKNITMNYPNILKAM